MLRWAAADQVAAAVIGIGISALLLFAAVWLLSGTDPSSIGFGAILLIAVVAVYLGTR